MINALKQANPNLEIHSVIDPEFSKFGRILNVEGLDALADAMSMLQIPEEGNKYEASVPQLEALPCMTEICETSFGLMPIEAGYCNGRGYTLNAFEFHKCSEVNFTTTGLVLLLALPEDLVNGYIDSSKAVAFYLPAGIAVEIYPMVMHFAPCRIKESGFNCLVVLEKGTNSPVENSMDKLLWMKNKWMTCHPDSPQAKKGAFQGITGENITLKI